MQDIVSSEVAMGVVDPNALVNNVCVVRVCIDVSAKQAFALSNPLFPPILLQQVIVEQTFASTPHLG